MAWSHRLSQVHQPGQAVSRRIHQHTSLPGSTGSSDTTTAAGSSSIKQVTKAWHRQTTMPSMTSPNIQCFYGSNASATSRTTTVKTGRSRLAPAVVLLTMLVAVTVPGSLLQPASAQMQTRSSAAACQPDTWSQSSFGKTACLPACCC